MMGKRKKFQTARPHVLEPLPHEAASRLNFRSGPSPRPFRRNKVFLASTTILLVAWLVFLTVMVWSI